MFVLATLVDIVNDTIKHNDNHDIIDVMFTEAEGLGINLSHIADCCYYIGAAYPHPTLPTNILTLAI